MFSTVSVRLEKEIECSYLSRPSNRRNSHTDKQVSVSVCTAVSEMAVFNVQKLFCWGGGGGLLFVTALRTICLTVGVIVGKAERVSGDIYSDVRVGVGRAAVWEQGAALLAISVCLMTIKFPSLLILFFLDDMFDYLSEGKGGGEANKHVTKVCFVFHSESLAL